MCKLDSVSWRGLRAKAGSKGPALSWEMTEVGGPGMSTGTLARKRTWSWECKVGAVLTLFQT